MSQPIEPHPSVEDADFLINARDLGKSLFRLLGHLPDSWERTGAMGRTEEAIAYIERLIEKRNDSS
jgi:hypothetical protein